MRTVPHPWLPSFLVALCASLWLVAVPAHAQLNLPATYAGDLPCADCPGIRYHLNLLADQTFAMRVTYLGRAASFDSSGRWVRSTDGAMLMLKGDGEPTLLSLRDAETLRVLDRNGNEIRSNLNVDLRRAAALTPLDIPLGRAISYPPLANAPLVGTNWKLTLVGDKIAPASGDAARQAGLTFEAGGRVSGSDGCNRVSGSYAQKDSGLSFAPAAAARMACPNMDNRDQLFARALSGTGRWRVTGDRLELMRPDGTRLALLVKAQ